MSRRSVQRLQGVSIGLVVTAACIAWFFIGRQSPAELLAFDWRMRHFNTLRADPRIVHVDIDDSSLERIGRWPWKRRQIAELIRSIAELGPRLVLVDLLLSEPEAVYYDDPNLSASAGESPASLGSVSEANIVYGDLELASAIRDAGNVVMSMQIDAAPPSAGPTLAERLQAWRRSGGTFDASAAMRALNLEDTPEVRQDVRQILTRAAVVEALQGNFTATAEEAAARLNRPLADVSAVFAGAKTLAARRLVAERFEGATPSWDAVLNGILGERAWRENADRRDVILAYERERAVRANSAKALRRVHYAEQQLYRSRGLTPAILPLALACADMAAVSFDADPEGTTRRVPLMVGAGPNRAYAHMGLVAAAHALGLALPRADGGTAENAVARIGDDQVARLRSADHGEIDLPLDEDGALLIHWAATAPHWRANQDMRHIPAAKLMALADLRSAMRHNEIAIRYKLADVVAAAKGEVAVTKGASQPAGTAFADTEYRRRVNRHVELEQALRRARLRGDKTPDEIAMMQQDERAMLEAIEGEQSRAVAAVRSFLRELEDFSEEEIAEDSALAAEAARYRGAQERLQEVEELKRVNAGIAARLASEEKTLSPLLADKYVFVGYAATALGDIVTTAIDPRTNGVMCHAHVFNTILQDRPIRMMPTWAGILICVLGGACASFVTASVGPKSALLATAGLSVAYGAVNCELLFKRMDTWAVLAAPEASIFLSWAFVTLFRQLTAERERRHFAKQLAQYTSPVLAARIAESPAAAAAFKTVQTRDITCFFSDLQGFTTLAETEDPEAIQHVLNTYLHRMSEVIWAQRGLLNKFMGDGIMAFFNASVDPMEDHARAAVETALSALEELERLKAQRAGDPAASIFQALSMRIGVAGGLCKNGDRGSELKADYTVIGDVVNLAARLEPANKVFGTRIMVSGPTRDAVRDLYEFRYLAELQVKGKKTTVPVYEVVCRKGALAPEQGEYIARFEAGAALYRARKWDECIVHFTRLLARRPDDAGASRYIDACQEMKLFPPDDQWRGALELKEK